MKIPLCQLFAYSEILKISSQNQTKENGKIHIRNSDTKAMEHCIGMHVTLQLRHNILTTTEETSNARKRTIWSITGYNLGIVSQKGLYLAIFKGKSCVILGKDGVARCINKECDSSLSFLTRIKNAVGARLLGVVDALQCTVTAPVFIATHSVVFLGTGIGTIILLPAIFHKEKGRDIWKGCAMLATGNLVSIVANTANLILTPIETVVPEFNIKVLKMNKWGLHLAESQGSKN